VSLLCVGSVALDDVETPHGRVEGELGGSAVYFSLAARFFTDVHAVGVVGEDFPKRHIDFLAEQGVDVEGIERVEGETFRWSGSYVGDMGNATTKDVRLGVFGTFRPTLPERYRDLPYVFLANSSPHTQMAVVEQMRAPRFVAADTMNLWIENERDALVALLGRIDCLFINDSEARQLTGEDNLIVCARRIQEMGPGSVVVKKGEHGAMLLTDKVIPLPAFPTEEVVDPTGAGDSFAGGFLGFTAQAGGGIPAGRALAYATVVASFTVGRFGVRGLVERSVADVDSRCEAFRNLLVT